MTTRSRALTARLICFTVTAGSFAATAMPSPLPDPASATVVANDNRRPAGTLDRGTLTLTLRAGRGIWRPEGPSGPGLSIEALGETSSALTVPAPMIRVEEGTKIAVSIRNDLDATLIVHGLCDRDGAPCATVKVPAGETRQAPFTAGRAGTYHYWATAMGAPVPFREMAGALIVDPPGGAAAPDRVLVITEWTSLTPPQLGEVMRANDPSEVFVKLQPRLTFVMNGLSWPATERLTYPLGEKVRWRLINLSSQHHPMHLHGFYFEVESLGDGVTDTAVAAADRHPVVTHLLRSGATMTMTWTPEREGNWLFHCHIMHHVSPERRLSAPPPPDAYPHAGHASHDASAGMAGMIMGITVVKGPENASSIAVGRDSRRPAPAHAGDGAGRRRARAVVRLRVERRRRGPRGDAQSRVVARSRARAAPQRAGRDHRGQSSGGEHRRSLARHGARQHLRRRAWVERQQPAPGADDRAGRSFVVRFTPPRTGTFMYHTHVHDERQLPLGLYGPMIVVDGDEAFDPAIDHVLIVARSGLDPAAPNVLVPVTPVVLNGEPAPRFVWKAAGAIA